MKTFPRFLTLSLVWIALAAPAFSQMKRFDKFERDRDRDRKSLLERDPDVVYLTSETRKPVMLTVVKEAPVFSDKGGNHRLGTLRAGQEIRLEAMTERAYFVRGQGTRDGIVGWVAPWAFSSKDPNFVANLKKLYARQIVVQKLIANKEVAMGMTLAEVAESRGKPTKVTMRQTGGGESGRWEYIDYEEQKNYTTFRDPYSGQWVRRLVSVTQVEKGKTVIEFENGLVSALEESESRRGSGNARIIVPPLVFGW